MRVIGIAGHLVMMAAATAGDTGGAAGKGGKRKKSTTPSGRKTGGQAAVPELKKLDDGIDEVVELMKIAKTANERTSEAVKELAKDSGFLATVVRSLATAKMNDKVGDKRREAGQMAFAFGAEVKEEKPAEAETEQQPTLQ